MSMLPSENHILIIQTFAKKEPEPCEIKINVTGKKHTANTVHFQKKATYSKKIKARQGHKI